MDYTKINGYSETMCAVIQAMIDANLSKIKCDRTVKGIIVDDSKADFNYYTVSENNITYIAYSNENGQIYSNNDAVYITIPNGDYDEQKFIIGKAYDDSSLTINTNALNNFIPFGNPIVYNEKIGIQANGNKLNKLINKNWVEEMFSDEFTDFDYIMISADFITTLSNCNTGTFGLQVEVDYGEYDEVIQKYLFLNQDMYGNIYGLKGATQKFLIPISQKTYPLRNIIIDLYQQGDFIQKDGIPFISNDNDNIIIEKIAVQFGYDRSKIEDYSINIQADLDQIYTNTNTNLGSVFWRLVIKDGNKVKRITNMNELPKQLNFTVLTYSKNFSTDNEESSYYDFENNNWEALIRQHSIQNFYIDQLNGVQNQIKTSLQFILYDNYKNILAKKTISFQREEEE